MRLKEAWRRFSRAQVDDFLRTGHEGRDHPSRHAALALLEGMGSVLDVGCGTGVMYELVRERRPDLDYLGLDVTPQFVRAARERFPDAAERFQEGSLYTLDRLGRTFDAVLARHVLEHLPDYVPAVQHLWGRTRKKLIIVFYLPPRPLRFRRRRDEKLERGFYTHTYDLGRFVDHVLEGLEPRSAELRVHPRQGTSDPRFAWGGRPNVVYEVLRAAP
ncbi:MAG: class I SAM-dependent methyltransferase [Candidatus Rokuibacteriota bacterium]